MDQNGAQARIRRIVAAFNSGQHDAARRFCADALRAAPADPVLNHLFARVSLHLGDFAGALGAAEASLGRQPGNASVHLVAGRAAVALEQTERAIGHFEAALRSGHPEAGLDLARALDRAGDRGRAQAAWARVRQADPASREAAARLGRLMWEDGKAREARDLLEFAASEAAPASAFFDLGLVCQDLGDLAAAGAAYRAALERRPDDAETAFNLGVVLQETGDMDAALSAYRMAHRLSAATFGMIAHALTTARQGMMFLDAAALRRLLAG